MKSTPIKQSASPTVVGKVYIDYCRRRLTEEYLPRIEKCFAQLSDEDIWWRPNEESNSIGNLILHLSGNIRQWIVSGLGGAKSVRNRPQEFSQRSANSKQELLELIGAAIRDADTVLEKFPAHRLLEMRSIQEYDVTCLDAVSHGVEHLAQHLGQIVYITKLRTGKDLKFYDL